VKFIENLQQRPEKDRRAILWIVIVVIGLVLGIVWIISISNNVQNLKSLDIEKEINIPNL